MTLVPTSSIFLSVTHHWNCIVAEITQNHLLPEHSVCLYCYNYSHVPAALSSEEMHSGYHLEPPCHINPSIFCAGKDQQYADSCGENSINTMLIVSIEGVTSVQAR